MCLGEGAQFAFIQARRMSGRFHRMFRREETMEEQDLRVHLRPLPPMPVPVKLRIQSVAFVKLSSWSGNVGSGSSGIVGKCGESEVTDSTRIRNAVVMLFDSASRESMACHLPVCSPYGAPGSLAHASPRYRRVQHAPHT
jgi:hypothetical protein